MLKYVIAFSISILFTLPGLSKDKKGKKQALARPGWAEHIPQDPAYYWGVGQAPIKGNDVGKAMETARDRAVNGIAKQIQVKIQSYLKSMLGVDIVEGGGSSSENVRRQVREWVKSRTNLVIKGVEKADESIGDKGVWVLMKLSRRKYEEQVEKELQDRRNRVTGFVTDYLKAKQEGRLTVALKNLILARDILEKLFPNLPFMMKTGDKTWNMHTHLPAKIDAILGGIEIKPISKGNLVVPGKALWQVKYEHGDKSLPMAKMPFRVTLEDCSGSFDKSGYTNTQGVLIIDVRSIRGCRKGKLAAKFSTRDLVGDLVDQAILDSIKALPQGSITVQNPPTVGYVCTISGLGETIEAAISDKRFEAKRLQPSGARIKSAAQRMALFGQGIDYVLIVKGGCSGTYIPMYRMYKTHASAVVELVNTKTGHKTLVRSSGARGFATTKSTGCSEAVSKNSSNLETLIRKVIDKIGTGM